MSKSFASFLDEVLLIVVIYRCAPENSVTWRCLLKTTEHSKSSMDLYLYDNSPIAQNFPPSFYLKTQYQHDPENPGVSKAFNKGMEVARRLGKKWMLFLDQDTSFDDGWLEKYFIGTLEQTQSPVKVPLQFYGDTMVSPFRYWATKGFRTLKTKPGIYSLKKYFAINSGILIDRQVFELVGGYDESIPLDFSDFALMWKLKQANYPLQVLDLQGKHELSSFTMRDKASAQSRFRQYCRGTKRLIHHTHQPLRHLMIAFGRAMLLGIRYRSTTFISILRESWAVD